MFSENGNSSNTILSVHKTLRNPFYFYSPEFPGNMSHQAQHDGGVCTNVPLLTSAGTVSLALANELAISNPVELEEKKIKKEWRRNEFLK